MGIFRAIPSSFVGILCVMGASLSFSTNDLGVKWLSGDYPLHEVILVRASIALIITLAIMVPLEGGFHNLRTKRPIMHLLRGLTVVIANMSFFVALASMPISEVTAIFFVAPLIITAFSVVFLKESVGIWRWSAVLTGLIGVVIILRPGSDAFQTVGLLVLVAATAYASLQIMTRKLGLAEKASTMAFYIQLTFIFVSAIIGLFAGDGSYSGTGDASLDFLLRSWVWPTNDDLLIMAGVGFVSACGGYLISQGYRLCEAGTAAPFEYVAMPLAVFWGVTFWDEWPDTLAWVGIAMIIGAGLFTVYRETVRGRKLASKRPVARPQ